MVFFSGDYWRKIPGNVSQMSATFNDDLWAVGLGSSVMRLFQRRVSSEENDSGQKRNVSIGESEGWMVVE